MTPDRGTSVGHDFKVTWTETVTVSDTLDKAFDAHRTFSDSVTVSDDLSKGVARTFSDSVTISDELLRSIGKNFSDSVTVSDSLSKGVGRTFSDSVSVSDDFSRQVDFGRTFSDSITVSDILSTLFTAHRIFFDSVTVSDDLHTQKMHSAAGMATDFSDILSDITPESVTLREETHTTDTAGDVTDIAVSDSSIDGYFVSTSLADRQIVGPGIPSRGVLTGYFAGTAGVEEGDIIIRDGVYWRVNTIVAEYRAGNRIVYVKTLLRRE